MAPDAPCSCCGSPSPAAATVPRMPHGERGSVRGLKGPIHGSQAHSGIPATQLGHAIHLSHSTLPTERGSPCPYRLRGRQGFESTKGTRQSLLWFSSRATPRWDEENSVQPYRDRHQWPGVYSCVRGSSQRRQPGKRNPNNGAWATP